MVIYCVIQYWEWSAGGEEGGNKKCVTIEEELPTDDYSLMRMGIKSLLSSPHLR